MDFTTNRRSLIAGSLALGAAGIALPRMAFAQGAGTRKLLFVLLRGAADGMATAAPLGDPGYDDLRGAARADYEGARRLDDLFTLHPAFEEVGTAFGAGEALIVHAAATSYRERSHFDGQNLLETGADAPSSTSDGWLNRLTAMVAEDAGAPPPRALAISSTLPLAMRGSAPASSYAPSALPQASDAFMERVGLLYQDDAQLAGLWGQALETQEMAAGDTMRNLRDARAAGELAASLMREEGGAGIAMMELGGWDTHANQRGAFARSARALDALLGAYRSGMGRAWSDTMVVVATEFGRTARYNGTGGTDHGTAAASLVMGGNVRGGRVVTDWPGLRSGELFEGRDLKPTVALENVLAGSIAEHMRLDPERALARLFPRRAGTPLQGITRG